MSTSRDTAYDGPQELHHEVESRLRTVGQRYTRNRRDVVEVLVGAARPLSLPELLDEGAHLSQSSTYRNLKVLEDAGVVRRLVHGSEHARFELSEDLTDHHHHLVCEGCGVIDDIELDATVEAALERSLAAVAAAHGFHARHHGVDLFGLCASCA
ncbi:MAG: transcriptional repressor [Acidimicrobiales bacterium]|nr:transcriptional repressor [Acidimicrobiales bacterium]